MDAAFTPTLTDFFNYNEAAEDIGRSIRNDLVELIVSEFFQKDFARFKGAGIELLENITDEPINKIIAISRIAEAIGLYNSGVAVDRQIVTSQQWITIISRGDLNKAESYNLPAAAWYIRVQYMLMSDLQKGQTSKFDLLIPSQGGA